MVCELGKKLAELTEAGTIIFLNGEIGTGKTTLARSLLQEMGVKERIKSPTYSICEVYALPSFDVYHYDLYRLESETDIYETGVLETFQSKNVCIIEWASNSVNSLPRPHFSLFLEYENEGRRVHIESKTNIRQHCLTLND